MTRGRISIPANVKRVLTFATIGWIVITAVVPPPVHIPPTSEQFGGLGGGIRSGGMGGVPYFDLERDLKERLLQEDEEAFIIIKLFLKCQG